jgi:hypothetical protein
MGRAFDKVIAEVPSALRDSLSNPIEASLFRIVERLSTFPLLVVGSGGSYSSAHFVARVHQQATGNIAQAITPFEMYYSNIDPRRHAILLITAKGDNTDILSSFKIAMEREFACIGIMCAKLDSQIGTRAQINSARCVCYEYENRYTDGFLAVNSLLSMCTLLSRAYGVLDIPKAELENFCQQRPIFDSENLAIINSRDTKFVLGGEWSLPAVIDFESKFSEAALGNVITSDIRNFGHGRHHWFDKRGDKSALIILSTPSLKTITKKTLSALPIVYPRMELNTKFHGALGGIDQLRQVSFFVSEAGKAESIDPGRPGVPEFGSRIYHIEWLPKSANLREKNRTAWLQRKCASTCLPQLVVSDFLSKFMLKLQAAKFGGIVFDYDGTLCDSIERFGLVHETIGKMLNNFLSMGIPIGIATGRGKSAQTALQSAIIKEFWGNCFIGNYNGAIVLPLDQDVRAYKKIVSEEIENACSIILKDPILRDCISVEKGHRQASISPKAKTLMNCVSVRLHEVLSNQPGLKIVQSSHSIDLL